MSPAYIQPARRAAATGADAAPPHRRRVDDEQITDDGHNDYARLLLGFGRTLERSPDDAARRDLLRRMQKLLPR